MCPHQNRNKIKFNSLFDHIKISIQLIDDDDALIELSGERKKEHKITVRQFEF